MKNYKIIKRKYSFILRENTFEISRILIISLNIFTLALYFPKPDIQGVAFFFTNQLAFLN